MSRTIFDLEQQYFREVKEFYLPYFLTSNALDDFMNRVFEFDWDERKPRQMLFQVQRFVTLANDIDKIRTARDGLKMMFLKCCMESLSKLSNIKTKHFFDSFASCFSDKGKKHILDNFSLMFIEYEESGLIREENVELSIDDFLCIIKAMRDMVVHEGNYWELQIFAQDYDSNWLTHIKTKEELLSKKTYANISKKTCTYHFQTTLQYEKFRYYFVEACLNFISDYMNKKQA